jgi:hypothetical protein
MAKLKPEGERHQHQAAPALASCEDEVVFLRTLCALRNDCDNLYWTTHHGQLTFAIACDFFAESTTKLGTLLVRAWLLTRIQHATKK